MKVGATIVTAVKLASLTGAGVLAGCGAHGKLRVDSPVLPYQAPDISEITGIDEDEAGSANAQPAGK
jgi:hypothetical protein